MIWGISVPLFEYTPHKKVVKHKISIQFPKWVPYIFMNAREQLPSPERTYNICPSGNLPWRAIVLGDTVDMMTLNNHRKKFLRGKLPHVLNGGNCPTGVIVFGPMLIRR